MSVGLSPFEAGQGKVKYIPNIIEWVMSPHYLNRPNLYPRQGTLLKIIFLQDELFTQYDYDVIGEWSEGFYLPEHPGSDGAIRYQGTHGLQPDILERIKINKAAGRPWFRENVIVIGRRGSKGYLGGVSGSYVLANFLKHDDPQQFYGIDRDKRMAAIVFAGKLQQARDEQWRDLTSVILGAPWFTEYISKPQTERLTIKTGHDSVEKALREARGIKSDVDLASIEIFPKESTMMSGRGPASFMLYFDEMAHVSKSAGASASAEEVYGSSTPSLDQFGNAGFIWEGSSPWQMSGQFYENWQHALEVDPVTKVPIYPEMFMVQLTSWDPYKDWEKAHTIPLFPKGYRNHKGKLVAPLYERKKLAIQEYDDNMRKLEQANPETFAVERRSHWSAAMNAYLNPVRIREMFGEYEGAPLVNQSKGAFNTLYVAHGDPSKVNDNFGLAIAHATDPDENGMQHVVFDKLHFWRPGDFTENDLQIDYMEIERYFIEDVLDAFVPTLVTFDQFGSVQMIQRLRHHVRQKNYHRRVDIHERTSTKPVNWKMAEAFKAALNMGLLHAPWMEQAELELTFLQDMGNMKVDHPDSGPVQSKDVADAMFNVVYSLIGNQMSAFLGDEFAGFPLTGALQGGQRPFPQMDGESNEVFSQFGAFNRARAERTSLGMAGRGVRRDEASRWSPNSPFGTRTR